MSTIGKSGRDILKYAQLSKHGKFLEDEKRRKQAEIQKRDEEEHAKRQRRLDIRKSKISAHLSGEEYEGPEFSSSIPQENTTMATGTLSTEVRGEFQSPVSSPPSTPPRTPRSSGPTLVRTETPVYGSLDWEGKKPEPTTGTSGVYPRGPPKGPGSRGGKVGRGKGRGCKKWYRLLKKNSR